MTVLMCPADDFLPKVEVCAMRIDGGHDRDLSNRKDRRNAIESDAKRCKICPFNVIFLLGKHRALPR